MITKQKIINTVIELGAIILVMTFTNILLSVFTSEQSTTRELVILSTSLVVAFLFKISFETEKRFDILQDKLHEFTELLTVSEDFDDFTNQDIEDLLHEIETERHRREVNNG